MCIRSVDTIRGGEGKKKESRSTSDYFFLWDLLVQGSVLNVA